VLRQAISVLLMDKQIQDKKELKGSPEPVEE
jgi:hypothetical protein